MSKHAEIEILPSPAEIARMPVLRAELDRLVEKRVAEILHARDEFMWEPFFRSRKIAYELKRLQTVSEQRKWSVYYQRFGCLRCDTMERIHVGNGCCDRCYPNTFNRLKQILGELIKEETAQPARGRLRLDRLLPATKANDGIHHTRYERSTEKERELFKRVADKLGLTQKYVRYVGVGLRRSDAVADAIREECETLKRESAPEKKKHAAPGKSATKDTLLARMPTSAHEAKSTSELFLGLPCSDSLAKKALFDLFRDGKIQRVGKGTTGEPFRYFHKMN